jgi:hypothetical protein
MRLEASALSVEKASAIETAAIAKVDMNFIRAPLI